MEKLLGFSMTEVLIMLSLASGTSLTLLQHQWQATRAFNQQQRVLDAISQQDSMVERYAAELSNGPFFLDSKKQS